MIIKKKLIIFVIVLPVSILAGDTNYYYQIERGDTFGKIIYSLGHDNLWGTNSSVNKFKHKSNSGIVHQVGVGDILRFSDSEIIFKNNVIISNDRIIFKKKINKQKEWLDVLKNEGFKELKIDNTPKFIVSKEKKRPTVFSQENKQSLVLYPGIGGFFAQGFETDRSSKTSTVTGIQPMAQLKAIYSHETVGSLAFDIIAKQIVNNEFQFPLNIDARFQVIPKWLNLNSVNLAFSYSMLKHSYIGKPEDEETEYELSANFLGVGIVWRRNSYWFETYLEKTINGKTESDEQSISLSQGWRIDSTLIYPIGKDLYFLPGINYYNANKSSNSYKLSVLEMRSTLAWKF